MWISEVKTEEQGSDRAALQFTGSTVVSDEWQRELHLF
jgi:hypothetical protein